MGIWKKQQAWQSFVFTEEKLDHFTHPHSMRAGRLILILRAKHKTNMGVHSMFLFPGLFYI